MQKIQNQIEERYILVKKIPEWAQEEQLLAIFGVVGEVAKIKLLQNKSIAYLLYKSKEDSQLLYDQSLKN